MRRIYLCIIIMGLAITSCQPKNGSATTSGIQDVTPIQFATLIQGEKGQLVDVRTPEEFASGYIDGAVNINFYDAHFSDLIKNQLDSTMPVYLYCRSGGRSAKAAQIISEDMKWGAPVYNLLGGYMAWPNADK